MENRDYILDRLRSKRTTIDEFNYDRLTAPPIASMFTPQDIYELNQIAKSLRLSAKPQVKYQMIDQIMRRRGFEKFIGGTNRVSYRPLEDNRFLIKVAYDAIGLGDNPREFQNQFLFKPFVTKVFEITPCGTLGVFERVNPITSREEFLSIADDVFEVINTWFVGEYVLEDIGTKFFMNWGIRKGFGPVLLDFPYVYKLDGNKLFCAAPSLDSPSGKCEGIIDYDAGFNFLYCTKCGVRYKAKDLAQAIEQKKIIVKAEGETKMKIRISGGSKNSNQVITTGEYSNLAKKIPSKPVKGKDQHIVVKKPILSPKEAAKIEEANATEMKEQPKKEYKKPIISPIEFDDSLKGENQEKKIKECAKEIAKIFSSESMTNAKRDKFIEILASSLVDNNISVCDNKNVEACDSVISMEDAFFGNLETLSIMYQKILENKNMSSDKRFMVSNLEKAIEKIDAEKVLDRIGNDLLGFLVYIAFNSNNFRNVLESSETYFIINNSDNAIDYIQALSINLEMNTIYSGTDGSASDTIIRRKREIRIPINVIFNSFRENGISFVKTEELNSILKNMDNLNDEINRLHEEKEMREGEKAADEDISEEIIEEEPVVEKHYTGFYYVAGKVVNIKDIYPDSDQSISAKVIVLMDPNDASYITADSEDGSSKIVAIDTLDDRSIDGLTIISKKWFDMKMKSIENNQSMDVNQLIDKIVENNQVSESTTTEEDNDSEEEDEDSVVVYQDKLEESDRLSYSLTGVLPPNLSVNGVSVEEESSEEDIVEEE